MKPHVTGRICLREHGREAGFSLLELIVALAILTILVGLAMPIARTEATRRKESQLRYALSELRRGLDGYKADCERGLVGPLDRRQDDDCYPLKLETLVDGIHPPNSTKTIRYLRAIPIDPMTGTNEWGIRSTQDEPDSVTWGGQNIWDVYSLSQATALNGTKYREW
jgi:general secretion pathway protein G